MEPHLLHQFNKQRSCCGRILSSFVWIMLGNHIHGIFFAKKEKELHSWKQRFLLSISDNYYGFWEFWPSLILNFLGFSRLTLVWKSLVVERWGYKILKFSDFRRVIKCEIRNPQWERFFLVALKEESSNMKFPLRLSFSVWLEEFVIEKKVISIFLSIVLLVVWWDIFFLCKSKKKLN